MVTRINEMIEKYEDGSIIFNRNRGAGTYGDAVYNLYDRILSDLKELKKLAERKE